MLASILGLIAIFAPQNTIPAPAAMPQERGSTVVSSNGKQVWGVDWTMAPATENGRPAVHFTETGRGRIYPYPMPVRWTLDAVWSADGPLRPLRFEKTITDENGRTVASERKIFDAAKGIVQFERKRTGEADQVRRIQVPPDTLTVEGIGGILRFLPFENWKPFTTHLFTNEPQLYQVKVEMRGKERIQTPAGEFECYKIELVPQLGVLDVLRRFFPKTFLWFTVAAPHFWVRYQGTENGRGSPNVVMDLKTYEPVR